MLLLIRRDIMGCGSSMSKQGKASPRAATYDRGPADDKKTQLPPDPNNAPVEDPLFSSASENALARQDSISRLTNEPGEISSALRLKYRVVKARIANGIDEDVDQFTDEIEESFPVMRDKDSRRIKRWMDDVARAANADPPGIVAIPLDCFFFPTAPLPTPAGPGDSVRSPSQSETFSAAGDSCIANAAASMHGSPMSDSNRGAKISIGIIPVDPEETAPIGEHNASRSTQPPAPADGSTLHPRPGPSRAHQNLSDFDDASGTRTDFALLKLTQTQPSNGSSCDVMADSQKVSFGNSCNSRGAIAASPSMSPMNGSGLVPLDEERPRVPSMHDMSQSKMEEPSLSPKSGKLLRRENPHHS